MGVKFNFYLTHDCKNKLKRSPLLEETLLHMCIHTFIRTYLITYLLTYILTYLHAYMHTYIQPNLNTYRSRKHQRKQPAPKKAVSPKFSLSRFFYVSMNSFYLFDLFS